MIGESIQSLVDAKICEHIIGKEAARAVIPRVRQEIEAYLKTTKFQKKLTSLVRRELDVAIGENFMGFMNISDFNKLCRRAVSSVLR